MKWIFYFIALIPTMAMWGLFYYLMDDKPKSLVVLADNGKTQNAVSIQSGEYEAKLDKVGATVSLQKGENPSDIRMMSKEEMNRRFGDVVKAEPLKAKKIILYLNEYNTDLNDNSKKDMALVVKTIKDRAPCLVDIIGHTDTTGDSDINIKLSLKRAHLVKELIKQKGIDVSSFSVKGYGEEDLLIPTKDNMKESKNRNVEVFIK